MVGYSSLRTLLAISASTGEKFSQADIGNAYIENSPDDDTPVYVEQAPGLEEMDPEEYVYRLRKSLYGMPFSGRTFQRVMEEFMDTIVFRRCISDKCVYIKWSNGKRIIVMTYVDDLVCLTGCEKLREWWNGELRKRFKKVTFNDECDWLLNMKIDRGVNSDGRHWVQLSQSLAIEKIAECMGLLESKRQISPCAEGIKLKKTQDGDKLPEYDWEYASVLGGVMYVANTTRPDIAYATSRLTRYLKNPNDSHCVALKRLVRYLYHTREVGLRYTGGGDNPFRLTAAADASFADCEDTKRSTLGWCQWLGDMDNGDISWGSRIGKTVALSTTESEVQAALELTKDVLWMRDFLKELGYEQKGSTRILEDNNGCMGQATNTKGMKKARHYLVALAKLNEAVQAQKIHLFRIDSNENKADQMTKGLGGSLHIKFGTWNTGYDLSFLKRNWDKARIQSSSSGDSSHDNTMVESRGSVKDRLHSW